MVNVYLYTVYSYISFKFGVISFYFGCNFWPLSSPYYFSLHSTHHHLPSRIVRLSNHCLHKNPDLLFPDHIRSAFHSHNYPIFLRLLQFLHTPYLSPIVYCPVGSKRLSSSRHFDRVVSLNERFCSHGWARRGNLTDLPTCSTCDLF